ncbi:MAG: glycosyltransferase family 4 protein, partial [Candidatus Nanoarchaeia archaeon]
VKEYTKKHEFIPDRKLELLHNGIDTKKFKKGKRNLRKELGFSMDDIVVGVVGRVDVRKGHKVLIDAIAEINDQKVKLAIIGTGPLEADLKKYVKDKNISERVVFAGFREDIVEAFNTLDLFCLPSKTEGLPLVVVEAMSCELPVIVTDIDSHRAIISDGKDGLLFPVNSAKALRKHLLALITSSDLRRKLKKNARKKALTEYDFSKNLADIEGLYKIIYTGESLE